MLKGTEEVDLDWGNFSLSWSISKTRDVQWSRCFWQNSSLGWTMGHTQREAVAEGSTSPAAPSWCCILLLDQDQAWQGQQAARLANGIPVPDVLTAVLRFLELVMGSRTEVLLWREPQAWKLVSWGPNWWTPIFFSEQRTSCNQVKILISLWAAPAAQHKNYCFRLPTSGIQSMVISLFLSWYQPFPKC